MGACGLGQADGDGLDAVGDGDYGDCCLLVRLIQLSLIAKDLLGKGLGWTESPGVALSWQRFPLRAPSVLQGPPSLQPPPPGLKAGV